MLLGHLLLNDSDEAIAAAIWRIRERTEYEVSALFGRLAEDLQESRAPDELVSLARRCAADELEHAAHCRRILDALGDEEPASSPDLGIVLGPAGAPPDRRALYTSVALGCITESLSTALLIEMRPTATLPEVREGLDAILRDEVRHSRLGWAHLAWASERADVSWLTPSVEPMIDAALATDELAGAGQRDLRRYGVLDTATVDRVCRETIESTIRPGLARFGVEATGSRER